MPDKKKSFKEIHGKTKIGLFLKEKAPNLLKTLLNVGGALIPGSKGFTDTLSGLVNTSSELKESDKEAVMSMYELDLKDIQDARDMYKSTDHKTADDIARTVIKINLPLIGALVVLNLVAVKWLQDENNLVAIVSNFIGIAIGHLFNERLQVLSFFFGSSRGSKDKTNILNK